MPNHSCGNEHDHNPFGVYIEDLDMDEITGVSCRTVHPIVSETIDWAMDNDAYALSVSNLFRQVASCMAIEFTKRMGESAIADPENPDLMLITAPEGEAERVVAFYVSLQQMADMFEDVANLALLAWQTASKRLGLEIEDARMPSAFPITILLLAKMFAAVDDNRFADYTEAASKLMELTTTNKELLIRMVNTDPINPPSELLDPSIFIKDWDDDLGG